MISVEEIEKQAHGTTILRRISFQIPKGVTLGIIGASGSGKTTLLRCLNGLERIDAGTIRCGDVTLEAEMSTAEYKQMVQSLRRKVGTVFQHLHLFPHLTVLDNITEAPRYVLGTSRPTAEAQARELLAEIDLQSAAHRFPESLSGGEQQRVAIARALAMGAEVLLFDEPTSALDARQEAELSKLLRRFAEANHTLIVVSHTIRFLEGLADYLLYIEAGEAVEFDETATVLRDPRDARTRRFLQ